MKDVVLSTLVVGVLSVLLLKLLDGEMMLKGCVAFSTSSFLTLRNVPTSEWRLFVKDIDTSNVSNNPVAGRFTAATPYDAKKSKRRPNNTNNRRQGGGGGGGRGTALEAQKRLNARMVESESANELFQALQQSTGALTKSAGGGVLSTVNFSTAIHRLAKHSMQPKARPAILADPRLALLLAAIAEALVDQAQYGFTARELSNICWALAKLRIAPPSHAMPLTVESSPDNILSIAKDLRVQIINVSKAKQAGETVISPVWVPTLSKLAGLLLDEIAFQFDHVGSIKQQEFSNALWAWATANRAEPEIFGRLVRRMIQQDVGERKPQEWSNACWAFATAKVYDGSNEMIEFVAELMEDESFVKLFKPQEMANMIWGLATLLSNRSDEISLDMQRHVLQIIRSFVPHMLGKIHNFKTQELSNALWGMATLGFGLTQLMDGTKTYYLVLHSESPALDQGLKNESVRAIAEAAFTKLHQFKSQELNNLAWSLARLVDEETFDVKPLLNGIGTELCKPRWVQYNFFNCRQSFPCSL
jgi:hypothetical protein